jgi:hypothetical protein
VGSDRVKSDNLSPFVAFLSLFWEATVFIHQKKAKKSGKMATKRQQKIGS